MYRYDAEYRGIRCICYSGIVRSGSKADIAVIEKADAALSKYLRNAGRMKEFPEIEAIIPKLKHFDTKITPGCQYFLFELSIL